jgi:hypothetical protein
MLQRASYWVATRCTVLQRAVRCCNALYGAAACVPRLPWGALRGTRPCRELRCNGLCSAAMATRGKDEVGQRRERIVVHVDPILEKLHLSRQVVMQLATSQSEAARCNTGLLGATQHATLHPAAQHVAARCNAVQHVYIFAPKRQATWPSAHQPVVSYGTLQYPS